MEEDSALDDLERLGQIKDEQAKHSEVLKQHVRKLDERRDAAQDDERRDVHAAGS